MKKCGLLWRLRLWWARLFIRRDEFHSSLSLDIDAYSAMTNEQRNQYMLDLAERRDLAHERDMMREEKKRLVLKKGG